MKALVLLAVYALLSGLIGLVVCSWLLWKSKRPSAVALVAVVCFGGPPALYGYLHLQAQWEQTNFEEDVAYVKELCAKYGGDKIYKTVENVEGVFQMKQRNPDQDRQWADQYGMVEPWALAAGDGDRHPIGLGTRKGQGYWFIEQQPGYGMAEGPPFRRWLLTLTTTKVANPEPLARVSAEGFALDRKEINVTSLKSRYGYTTEDLSTPELRKRWIGGGKLKIIDLQTKEVLAERTDYYRATGPEVKMAWAAGTACPPGPPFLADKGLHDFIMAVLRPPRALPTTQQISQLLDE